MLSSQLRQTGNEQSIRPYGYGNMGMNGKENDSIVFFKYVVSTRNKYQAFDFVAPLHWDVGCHVV